MSARGFGEVHLREAQVTQFAEARCGRSQIAPLSEGRERFAETM
jgi:hypothetical protein